MQIFVMFHFNGETSPVMVTVVEGAVSDILLPLAGDWVQHCDAEGAPFEGRVTERKFLYHLKHGTTVNGSVAVTLCLNREARKSQHSVC